jgi:hypothetical protein
LSTGTDFNREITFNLVPPVAQNSNGFRLIYVGDFDGDGQSDLLDATGNGSLVDANGDPIQFSHNPMVFLTPNNTVSPFPDLIKTIDNGIGGLTTFTYKPLTDDSVYASDVGSPYEAQFPYTTRDFELPIYVVSDTTVTDGLGAQYPYSYSYGGGKLNQEGRGWLGFRWRETNDLDPSPNARKKRTTQFSNQTFPFTGTPSETHVYDATNPASPVEFAETAQLYNDPAPQPFPGRGIYFVQLQRTDSFEWDGVGTARQSAKTFEYDARNNLKRTQSLGDLAVNDDQRDEVTDWQFVENATTFLDRPTHTRLFDGDSQAGGTLRREKWLFYDNQNWGVLGTRGLVTREESRATLSDTITIFTLFMFTIILATVHPRTTRASVRPLQSTR